MKIMIVDDHTDMRRVLRQMIVLALDEPVEFIECARGEQALAAYASGKPDVVLLDIELQTMSGFEVAEELRGRDASTNIIIVTSYDTPTFRRKANKLKVQGFVAKDNLAGITSLLLSLPLISKPDSP